MTAGRPSRLPGAAFLIVTLLAVVVLFTSPAASQTCARDTYTSLPAGAVFPTDTLSATLVPTGRALTKGHWSERAQYSKYRPAKVTPLASPPAVDCPHLQAGLKDWHNPTTWGGAVPANGANVNIPAASKVLVSSCSINSSFVFGTITVPAGSELIFGDAKISIAARGFNVLGSLLIGSPTCRLRNKVTITLYGSRGAQALPAASQVKGIAVSGRIDIHGMQYFPTWSRLAMTAEAGDKYLFIQDMVNWQPGQSIFVTTTELKDSRDWHRNEVRKIVKVWKTSLDATVSAIELDSPLSYKHYGGREYQAEVGLLSRNIIIQGDAASEPTDTVNATCTDPVGGTGSTYPCNDKYLTGFGGHVQVMGAGARGRFSGVELYRMGQTNVLGRYPLHWHMVGTTNSSVNYATDCSVHNSFFRCYTIHGTHGVRLAENTAYSAIGNCFYLSEDGVEENNTVQYNLAAHVHILGNMQDPSLGRSGNGFWGQYLSYYTNTSSLLIPADMSAAPFYVTNMYNTIEGNAASGGWTGFSFPSLPAPTGNHKDITNFNPANRPFRTPFRGNTAHSTGFWWASAGAFYFGGEMTYTDSTKTTLKYTEGRSNIVHDTCSDKTVGTPASTNTGCWDLKSQLWLELEDNKAFLANRGLQAWGNRANIQRIEIHDTALSMNVFGQVWVNGMLMECRSNHRPTSFAGCPRASATPRWGECNVRDFYFFTTIGGFQWYDVGQNHIVQNSTFRNCRNDWSGCIFGSEAGKCNGAAVFTSLTHSDQFVPQIMQITSGINYTNCNNIWRSSTQLTDATGETVSGRMQSWLDADGTASGTGQRSMIGSAWADQWWKMNDGCQLVNERWVCRMAQKDSSAAVKLSVNTTREAQIGSTICANGGGTKPCPVIGKATHFGRTNESLGVDVAVMGQLTGPLIAQSGGWFVRYTAGTPKQITLKEIQVDPKDSLVLAFPYPAGTTFNITFEAADWCSTSWGVCRHPFRPVSSALQVYNGFGDVYFWNNTARVLYVRATMQPGYFGSPGTDAPWTSIPPAPNQFSRGGLTIPVLNYGPTIKIRASCSTDPCAPQSTVSVPPKLF
jgi:hypothetical protein